MSDQHVAGHHIAPGHDAWLQNEVVRHPRIIHRPGDEEIRVTIKVGANGDKNRTVDYSLHTVLKYDLLFPWRKRGFRLRFDAWGCWELEELLPVPQNGRVTVAHRSRLSGPKTVHWETWVTEAFGYSYANHIRELAGIIDEEIAMFVDKQS